MLDSSSEIGAEEEHGESVDHESLNDLRGRLRKMGANRKANADSPRYDTSDIAQEALCQIWKERDKSLSDEEFRQSWLWKVVRGHAAKLHRFHRAARRSTMNQVSLENEDPATETSADEVVEQREQVTRMLTALDELHPLEKHVVLRHFFEGQSMSAIARHMETTLDIVRSALTRALRKMRRHLSSDEPGY